VDLSQLTRTADVTPDLREQLVRCWVEVTNAGGAAGFPFPPVRRSEVAPVLDRLTGALAPERSRLLVARDGDELAGWVLVARDPFPLVAHWAEVRHLQTRLAYRGRGIGSALMRELHRMARDEMCLEQLHLAARGGMGLERFYGRLGWREVGRWPAALRLGPGDDRDEVLMVLAPL
jgi:GNAT superfamily N-acetyltransferase